MQPIDPTYQMRPGETPQAYNARIATYNAQKSGLPDTTGAPTPTLPDVNEPGNGLVTFKNTLSAVADLARRKRNEQALQFMTPMRGTVAASDFNGILNNLNGASEHYTQDLLKTANDAPKYNEVSPGATLYDPTTGKAIYTAPTTKSQNGGGTSDPNAKVEIHSGALQYTKADYAEDSQQLEDSRGDDGYVDPSVFQALYQAWVKHGGTAKDFLAKFPPKNYVNPENTWLAPLLRNPKKASGVDFNSL